MLLIIALTIVEISQIVVATGTTVGFLVVGGRYLRNKYISNLDVKTKEHPVIVDLKDNQKILIKLVEDMKLSLTEGFEINSEDHVKLNIRMDEVKQEGVMQALNVVKSLAITDPTPTLIYHCLEDEFTLIWQNEAAEKWTGLDLEDTRSGGDVLSVSEADRAVIVPSIQKSVSLKEEVDVVYNMVVPETQELIGKVWVHAYPLFPNSGSEWYYVNRVKLLEPAPGFEHLTHFSGDRE